MKFLKNKHVQKDIIAIIQNKNLDKRYLIFIVGVFIYALAYNVFFLKYNLVYGGVGGIAILFRNYISPSVTMLIVSLISLIVAYIFLDKSAVLNSIVGTVLLPIFVTLTSNISISVPTKDLMLIAICGATVLGVANGIIGKTGLSMGGLDHFVRLIEQKFKISTGRAFLILNGIIVLIGGYQHGWTTVLYALVIIYIMSIITDKVLLGVSANKTFFIVTNKEVEVKKYILDNLSRGVTVLDAHGGFSNDKVKVIMCVIPSNEYFKAKEGILEIDPKAFFTITDSYQVLNADAHRENKTIWEEK